MGKKKEQAVVALLEHPTVREAAQAVGIGEATLFRWLQVPEFQDAYREGKRQIVNHAISRLQQATVEAVETLREIMRDKEKPPSPRVTAAKAVLEISVKAIEMESLEARLEELEEAVLNRKGGI
ncbi:MAG: hypothetical protein ABID54_05300 [Pseudomonadota bacterium]